MSEQDQAQDQGQNGDNKDSKKKKQRISLEDEFYGLRRILGLVETDTKLKTAAGEFSFTAEKLAIGTDMGNGADSLYEAQKKARALQLAASRLFKALHAQAKDILMELIRRAKVAFEKDPDMLETLGLNRRRRRSFGKWIAQSKIFFNRLLENPAALEQMAKYNTTLEELQAGKQLLLDTADAEAAHESAKAEAQRATELRNIAFNEFARWMAGFIKVMTVALEDDPQLKEKLGIVTPSKV